ncbi:phage tail tape measure protein [Tropicimonas sp. IMCC6043]|uniref:phage tail tape measure protein n=1 Tax=Tropicimonas sp. IMCC6043 TaxID=2510645 RepID=UPI00101D4211|nr:phage tail tape measure protein [Tropicimonas sp. IMCC6043]RYH11179.1 phage tail tape measure protein [Tropicimonas sp. IMCC6043]
MAFEFDGDQGFSGQVDALQRSLADAGNVMAAFDGELRRMRTDLSQTSSSAGKLSTSIGGGLRRAFEGLVFDGMNASDAMKMVAQSIVDATYSAAIQPVIKQIGGSIASGFAGIGAAAFAGGGSFAQGRVMPFARGGVVTAQTVFPMRGRVGLMGEAGPEAIMPLSRGADGRLGVRAEAGGQNAAPSVVVNISTPDIEGFRRSQSQVAAQLGRALGRGQRNR